MSFHVPEKKRWSDLSMLQRIGIVSLGIVQVTLLISALVDIRRRPAEQIKGSKRLWAMAAFVNYIGPISYFIWGRKRT